MKKWRCTVCGYVHVGDEPPDKCPVCGADKSKFVEIVEEAPASKEEEKEAAAPLKPAVPSEPKPDVPPPPEAETSHPFVIRQMLKFHAHPIAVHIPNGVLPAAFIFIVLSVITGFISLGTAALWNMAFVVISLPFVLFSGYIEWQKRYQGLLSGLFVTKIIAAGIVTVISVVLLIWWIANPDILQTPSMARNVFIFAGFIMLAAAGIAGHIGGKLVFKD